MVGTIYVLWVTLAHFYPVTLAGSALFILFGIIYLYEAFHPVGIDVSDISYPS